RFTPLQILSWSTIAGVAAGVALVAVTLSGSGSVVLLMLPLAVVMAAVSLAMPNTPALALSRHGEVAGTAAALLGTVQFGVGALVAPLVGAFGEGTAVPMAAVILAVTALGAVLTWAVVRPATRRAEAA
ncbi:Bcr/CflA family drug resistance efflux transporter, partial [Solicola sp. PLA-1-18]